MKDFLILKSSNINNLYIYLKFKKTRKFLNNQKFYIKELKKFKKCLKFYFLKRILIIKLERNF